MTEDNSILQTPTSQVVNTTSYYNSGIKQNLPNKIINLNDSVENKIEIEVQKDKSPNNFLFGNENLNFPQENL